MKIVASICGALSLSAFARLEGANLFTAADIDAAPVMMTSDQPGSHVVNPNDTAFGVATGGVGRVGASSGSFSCSGALLATGQHVLTAAHCAQPNLQVTFDLPSGSVTVPVQASQTHESWDGNALHGFDVAVLTLSRPAPASIPRYDLHRGLNDVGMAGVFVGYGDSGLGIGGATLSRGDQRAGLIRYEATGLGSLSSVAASAIWNSSTQLTSDFDPNRAILPSGNHDGFNVHFALPSEGGFGADEVGFAPGDSGGPTFFDGKIGGVASYVVRLGGAQVSDVDGARNYSWGEFSVSARVAEPTMIAFIDSQLGFSPIPEANGIVLGLLGLAWTLRRHRF